MSAVRINLYSDTQTLPTAEMRRAIAEAPVGDEQRGEDPSVNLLCHRVADLLGKDAAVFLPSGTMANEIAILVHCHRGDEIIADKTAHILNFEGGGPAALTGANIMPLDGRNGIFEAKQVEAAIRQEHRHAPRSRMLAVEQTANLPGGTIWPLETIRSVCAVAAEHGLARHLDGARLLNAVVAKGVPASDWAAPFDSAWIDLSKGLGCPMGAVLTGSEEFIAEGWRWKQRMGGALRQAGIAAAAGVYALDHHVERLADDHANAIRFADRVRGRPGLTLDPDDIQSNMVFVDVAPSGLSADEVGEQLAERGIRISTLGATRLRAVTHLDVTTEMVEEAAAALVEITENAIAR